MRFYHRIRAKLLFAFIPVALIPALASGLYSLHVSSRLLLAQELDAQARHVASLKNHLESFLTNARRDVLFLSESAPMQAFLKARITDVDPAVRNAARHALQQEFHAFARQREIYHQLRYIDESGMEIARVDRDGSTRKLILPEHSQNQAGRHYFTDSVDLSVGALFVSPLALNRVHGKVQTPHKPVIRYATPVKYPNGTQAGIVIANVDAGQFLNLPGTVQLVDADGFYLAHGDATKTWGSNRDLNTGANLREDLPNMASTLLQTAQGTLATGTALLTYQKVAVPGSSRQWTLIAQRPRAELLASVPDFLMTFLAILTVTVLAGLAIAWLIGRQITRPVEYLTAMADQVGSGELLTSVAVRDQGELGQLAQAFERMRVSMIRMMERLTYRKSA